jgi:hypothetical protein
MCEARIEELLIEMAEVAHRDASVRQDRNPTRSTVHITENGTRQSA